MKHTPGPWELKSDPSHYDTLSSIEGGGSKESAFRNHPRRELMAEVGGFADMQTQEANARLIAAAPDLLEALEAVVLAVDDYSKPLGTEWLSMARKAINKAKGGAI